MNDYPKLSLHFNRVKERRKETNGLIQVRLISSSRDLGKTNFTEI